MKKIVSLILSIISITPMIGASQDFDDVIRALDIQAQADSMYNSGSWNNEDQKTDCDCNNNIAQAADLEKASTDIVQLQEKLNEALEQKNTLQEMYKESQRQYDQALKDAQAVEQELLEQKNNLEEMYAQIQVQYNQVATRADEAEQELSEQKNRLQAMIEDAQTRYKEAVTRAQTAEKDLDTVQKDALDKQHKLQEMYADAQLHYTQAIEQAETAQEREKEACTRIERLTKENEYATALHKTAEQELHGARQEIEKLALVAQENKELKEQLKIAHAKADTVLAGLGITPEQERALRRQEDPRFHTVLLDDAPAKTTTQTAIEVTNSVTSTNEKNSASEQPNTETASITNAPKKDDSMLTQTPVKLINEPNVPQHFIA